MGHGCIHLSLVSTFVQFCRTFNSFFCEKYVNFCTNFAKAHKKSHTKTLCWRPQKAKTWNKIDFWDFEAIEGLINKGFIFIFYFHPLLGSLQCTLGLFSNVILGRKKHLILMGTVPRSKFRGKHNQNPNVFSLQQVQEVEQTLGVFPFCVVFSCDFANQML